MVQIIYAKNVRITVNSVLAKACVLNVMTVIRLNLPPLSVQ